MEQIKEEQFEEKVLKNQKPVLVDFFATISLALVYLLSVEVGGKGQLTLYSLASFLLGIFCFNYLWGKIAHSLRARWRGRKASKK